jgi:hypothetical protein
MPYDMSRQYETPAPVSPAGVTSMLSLFLLLMTFFMVLVTMVEFDEKRTHAALGSLNETFAPPTDDVLSAADGAGAGAEVAMQRLLVEVGAVLAALLRDGAFNIERVGPQAIIRIDNDALFSSELTPAPALDAFAAKLAALVSAPGQDRSRFEMVIVEPLGEASATRRAGLVVQALESAGIAADGMMLGLAPTTPDETRIEIQTLPQIETILRQPKAALP